MRALNRDILAYNDDTIDDLAEETGWKLVHGDVFRGPQSTRAPECADWL